MPKRVGRKSAAQTPAPKSERIYGSKKNVKGSASSEKSAKKISFSDKTITALKNKLTEFKEKHKNKKNITLGDLKAVYRRGSGAYSSSHRPTITGGVPNSRNAWAMARVNKFLKKAGGEKVKAAYVQDDDLMANGGKIDAYTKIINDLGDDGGSTENYSENVKAFYSWFRKWNKGILDKMNIMISFPNEVSGLKSVPHKEDNVVILDLFEKIDQSIDAKPYLKQIIDKADEYGVTIYLFPEPRYKYITDKDYKKKITRNYLIEYYKNFGFVLTDDKEFMKRLPKDEKYEKGGKFNDKELLAKYKRGESIGFTAIAHLKAKGLIPRADGNKRKSDKYKNEGGEVLSEDVMDLYDVYKYSTFQKFESGGMEQITCMNCGWHWNEADSDPSDKYVCHKCGFDNTLYYDTMNKLKKPKTLSQISEIHGVAEDILKKQLDKGIEAEMEHTTDNGVAEVIALHHIEEMPDYYDRLQKMENIVNEYKMQELKEGGVVVGKRHSESDEMGNTGERFLVKSTGQVVELEGGEGVLCKQSMSSDKIFTFEGKQMTAREIASFLNHKYGGVKFEKGGGVCGCKQYYHGGELPSATLDSLEGGEAVVTVKTMESKDRYEFQGMKMTPRKILSTINAKFGGKKFEEGGTIDLSRHKMKNQLKMINMYQFAQKILYFK